MVEIEQFYEEYVLGHERITGGRTITETDIVTHAMHSGDFYPHHVDAEFAKKGPFGQRIAQFSCTFSIGIALTASIVNKRAFTYGFERLRFPNPVFIGDTIHTKVTIKEIKDASIKIAVDSVKKIISTSVDKSKLDSLFDKNLEETKAALKKINS